MWHMVWGEHSLKFQLSSLTVWDLWRLEYFEEMDDLMNESLNEWVNELMTKGFIEQARLHRVHNYQERILYHLAAIDSWPTSQFSAAIVPRSLIVGKKLAALQKLLSPWPYQYQYKLLEAFTNAMLDQRKLLPISCWNLINSKLDVFSSPVSGTTQLSLLKETDSFIITFSKRIAL